MALKQLEIEKIIDKFYSSTYSIIYPMNCDFHIGTNLVIKKVLHHSFPAVRSMCFTALAECPICNSKFIVFGGGVWSSTVDGEPLEYFPELPIIFRVEDVQKMLKVVKMFSHPAHNFNSIKVTAIKYLLFLYLPLKARKYLKSEFISIGTQYTLLTELDDRLGSMKHEHQIMLGTINLISRYYTSGTFTQVYFTDQLLKAPKSLQQVGKE